MNNFIIFAVLFLIVSSLFLKSLRTFFRQLFIRKRLKRGLKPYKNQLKNGDLERSAIFERVYEETLVKRSRFWTSKRKRNYERRVHKELKRIITNPLTALFAWLFMWWRAIWSVFLSFWVLVFWLIVVDEYNAVELTLPTVDPDVEVKLESDVEDSFGQFWKKLFADLASESAYDFTEVVSEQPVPKYMERTPPEAVTNAAQLGQAIAYYMAHFEEGYTIYYKGPTANFEKTLDEAWSWLEKNEVYLSRMFLEISWQYTDYGSYVELVVDMDYDMTKEQNALALGKVEQIVQAMPKGLTDAEKVKYVNDYIVVNTKYNLNSKESPYTPYSILLNGEGVCEGYALTALLLFDALGIEARYITGNAVPGGAHAWNLVKLDGQWYHLDITWNDPMPDQGNKVHYDYYLISDKKIGKDHAWIQVEYPVAVANY
ncbi:MAG: transglutaminase domain-containing protein [Solibacillus sp.]